MQYSPRIQGNLPASAPTGITDVFNHAKLPPYLYGSVCNMGCHSSEERAAATVFPNLPSDSYPGVGPLNRQILSVINFGKTSLKVRTTRTKRAKVGTSQNQAATLPKQGKAGKSRGPMSAAIFVWGAR